MTAPRDQPYADPYLAGGGLGLVLLGAFVLTGRGLGASGAFASTASGLVSAIAPSSAAANGFFSRYLSSGGPAHDWLVFEIAGVFVGGFLSALAAGRLRLAIERGPRITAPARLVLGFFGGGVMGLGAALARGCTSGLALTGGALLAVGSWLFIAAAFATAYVAAPLLRRVWQ